MTRESVRKTAGRVLRSEDLAEGEQEAAAAILRANPELGNPHVVRCGFCHESRTLFDHENEPPFKSVPHGWLCEKCNVRAASQEVKM